MTVADLYEVLDEMRKVYRFEDDKTAIRTGGGVNRNQVEIETTDPATNVLIHLSLAPKFHIDV